MAQEKQPTNNHGSMHSNFWDGNKPPLHKFLAEQRKAESKQLPNNVENPEQLVHRRIKIID
ncbi:MAG: hypothetical protein Q8P53_03545 [Candidatus Shapirobacteria bacterium]|nr:hypothetical protein [Candidatus Shapirobacteria bacterium]